MKKQVVKCSCGAEFKNESFASAEAQFRCHVAILSPGGKLSSPEHKREESKS